MRHRQPGRLANARTNTIPAVVALLLAMLVVQDATPARAGTPTCAASAPASSYGGGSGTDSDPYLISDVAGLLRLADPAQSADWDKHFLQTADIDLAGCDWTPISFDQTPWVAGTLMFSGTYDGGGREVRNMSFDDETGKNNAGMFGVVNGATIENLTLQVRIRSDGYSIGGLIGIVYGEGVTVLDVHADVDIVAQEGNAGGLIGEGDGPILLERSQVSGTVSVQGGYSTGGLMGLYYGSSPAELLIIDSVSSAAISSLSSTMSLGGVVGSACGPTRVSDTVFDGSLSGAGTYRFSGRPAGSIDPPIVITGVGGVIGEIGCSGAVVVVSDVRVQASGIAGVEAVGGVVGNLGSVDTLSIERTVVRAPVSASLEFGGCLIGWFADGVAEQVTIAQSFSRSTTNVAGMSTQCPYPVPADSAPSAPLVTGSGVVPALSPGVGVWQDAAGSETPLTVSSPGSGQVRYSAPGLQVTLTGTTRSNTRSGLVADPRGVVECKLCAFLAEGGVVESWVFSEPRLVAAWRVEELAALAGDLPCQRFTIPVGTPLDGGDPLPPGVHTLQLQLPTTSGMQAVNVGVTVTGPAPSSIPAGEGWLPGDVDRSVPAGLVALLLGPVLVLGSVRRRRAVTAG